MEPEREPELLQSLPESGVRGGVAIAEAFLWGISLGWERPEVEWAMFTAEIGMALEG
jgi:hypothetical protein